MKNDARSLSSSAQEALRRRAVAAVKAGMTQTEAATVFGVTRQAVGKWMKAYRIGGEGALTAQPQGRPEGETRLKGWQAAAISKLITDRDPDQLRLPFVLWTREAVRVLIFKKYGVQVSPSTVGRYLTRWGFTPQKPVRRAYEGGNAAVQRWLEEEYPAIVKAAKKENALIYWGDEMGVRSDHQAGRSYAPKGKTPVVAGTGQRFGCNVVSAITNRGHLEFMVFKKGFTAQVFIRFLKRLVKQAERKVYIIVDRHPVHRSRKVTLWIQENANSIERFFLPGYSPELNPDEMVNNDVKANAVGRKRANNRIQLMRNVRTYLRRRKEDPVQVQKYFHEKSVRYAAL